MQRTIRKQLSVYVIGTICFITILNMIFNAFFLEKIYINKQENEIKEIYNLIKSNNISENDLKEIYRACLIKNIKLFVTDKEFNPIYYSFDKNGFSNEDNFVGHMKNIEEKNEIIEENNEFYIVKIEEKGSSLRYLELRTKNNNSNNILIRISLDNIKESLSIYNKITSIILLIGLIIGIILTYFISKKISNPIKKLTEISKDMINLNFKNKYNEKSNNEIDILGNNFNELSNKLNITLNELQAANRKLEDDIHILEKEDIKRKEFISNVSHELKTPIALIEGYAEALKDNISDNPEDNEEYCNIIIDESIKMNKLVRQLIELIQAEEITPIISKFNIYEMTKNLVNLYSKDNLNIKITQKGNLDIYSDEFKVERVITNYLTNAINHVNKSHEININIEELETTIKFEIFNKGENIPEEDIGSIWDRFYKVDKARTREYGGSGIGLSIVKENIKSLKGTVNVENKKDGVLFSFIIPKTYK